MKEIQELKGVPKWEADKNKGHFGCMNICEVKKDVIVSRTLRERVRDQYFKI